MSAATPVTAAADMSETRHGAIAASLRIVKGSPTAEQLAAVVAALTVAKARADRESASAATGRSRWGMPALRTPLPHGRDAWRHALRNR